jgi:hypothetical protein
MTQATTVLPERKTYGGCLTRVIEPGRHVYQTKRDFISWAGAVVTAGTTAVCTWGGFYILSGHYQKGLLVWAIAVMSWIFALVFVGLGVFGLSMRATLIIEPSLIELRHRWFAFKPSTIRRWSTQAFIGARISEMGTFQILGSTPVYGIEFMVANGEHPLLHRTFDELHVATAVIEDINASIRAAKEGTGAFFEVGPP